MLVAFLVASAAAADATTRAVPRRALKDKTQDANKVTPPDKATPVLSDSKDKTAPVLLDEEKTKPVTYNDQDANETTCDICAGRGVKVDTVAGYSCQTNAGEVVGGSNIHPDGDPQKPHLKFNTEVACLGADPSNSWNAYTCESTAQHWAEDVDRWNIGFTCQTHQDFWDYGGEAGGCCNSHARDAKDKDKSDSKSKGKDRNETKPVLYDKDRGDKDKNRTKADMDRGDDDRLDKSKFENRTKTKWGEFNRKDEEEDEFAAYRCKGDLIWKQCGAACEATCARQEVSCDRTCVQGCRCPAGLVRASAESDKCVAPEFCYATGGARRDDTATTPGRLDEDKETPVPYDERDKETPILYDERDKSTPILYEATPRPTSRPTEASYYASGAVHYNGLDVDEAEAHRAVFASAFAELYGVRTTRVHVKVSGVRDGVDSVRQLAEAAVTVSYAISYDTEHDAAAAAARGHALLTVDAVDDAVRSKARGRVDASAWTVEAVEDPKAVANVGWVREEEEEETTSSKSRKSSVSRAAIHITTGIAAVLVLIVLGLLLGYGCAKKRGRGGPDKKVVEAQSIDYTMELGEVTPTTTVVIQSDAKQHRPLFTPPRRPDHIAYDSDEI